MIFMCFLVGIVGCALLGLIWKELKKIENKLEHPDDRPKHEKHWGWGKHKE